MRDKTDFPVQFYAATKKSCEVMSHAFTTIYKLPTTVLRFFTVYGPYGRPDMAYYNFAENIQIINKCRYLIMENKQEILLT